MLKLLIKTQLLSIFSSLTGKSKAAKSGKKPSPWMPIVAIILLAYLAGVLGLMMFGLSIGLCTVLVPNGYAWLYFAIPFALSFLLTVFLGIFSSQSTLFNARDNELLLSMPIKPRSILASRILMMLIPDYLFELIMIVISGGVYLFFYGATLPGVLILLLFVMTVPLLAMAVSCMIGWVIALIISRIKRKQLATTVISVIFMLLYIFGYTKLMNSMNSITEGTVDISTMVAPLADSIGKYLPPLKWLGLAISAHNPLYTLLMLAVTVIPFVIIIYLLSISFIRIVTSKRGAAKTRYTGKPMKENSQNKALLLRDLKRVGGSAVYLMNACIGALIMIIIAVLIVVRVDFREIMSGEFAQFAGIIAPAAVMIICMISSMISVTASSISLEGKFLWIIKTLPVKTSDILFAKVKAHLVVALPASLITSTILCFTVRPTLAEIIPYYLFPLVFNVFCAMFGLIVNLRFPKMDWVNEAQPVKQSAASAVSMFAPMAILAIIGAMLLVPAGFLEFMGIFNYAFVIALTLLLIIFAVLCYAEYRLLRGWGVRRFNAIN